MPGRLRRVLLLFSGFALAAARASVLPAWLVDPTVQLRVGIDTNPVAAGGSAAPILGTADAATFAAGFAFSIIPPAGPGRPSVKLTYATETVRFDGRPDENFSSHRLALAAQAKLGAWKLSADASTLFVDGSRSTLPSLAACNGNAVTVWRERRAQWQHRAKLAALRDAGALRLRVTGALLDYDCLTRFEPGRVAFPDRRDLVAGVDAGWLRSANSWWFVGARAGTQHQDQSPLPGAAFDYSSRYTRLVAGWEGRLGADTTLTLAAGPDFRHYDGTTDPKVFRGRDRTLGWFDASFATKLAQNVAFTAKATRWTFLSSTGKSALTDFCADFALTWTVDAHLSLRATSRLHQCSYFPTIRNDWETQHGLGLVWKFSPARQLSLDVLDHRGWNELAGVADRNFTRQVLSLGASWKF